VYELDRVTLLTNVVLWADKARDKEALSLLLDILLTKNEEELINVRVMAAKAIANTKNTSAVTSLLYCLNNKDEHYKVRLACADALGRIGDKYATSSLIDVMKDEDEKSVYVREGAVFALGMIGDARAADSLVSILEAQKGLWGKFTFFKERVIEALSKLQKPGCARVFKALKNALLDESAQVRINAIEAIMESEHSDAAEVIRGCLDDEDDEVKKNALIALYNLEGADILDEVLNGNFSQFLKEEAQYLISEYESEDE
jgi:HEAT repeat protein